MYNKVLQKNKVKEKQLKRFTIEIYSCCEDTVKLKLSKEEEIIQNYFHGFSCVHVKCSQFNISTKPKEMAVGLHSFHINFTVSIVIVVL